MRGLYLLADEQALPWRAWKSTLLPVLDCQPRLVQYRAKALATNAQRDHAGQLLHWCRERGIPLLINDDPALCRALGADGVHLGRDDAGLAAARQMLGPHALIGVSCYGDIDRGAQAWAGGVDYLSFGRLFPSHTKPQATATALTTLDAARQRLPNACICGIGGITPDNAAEVRDAGADLLCAAGGVLMASNPIAAARKIATIAAGFNPSNS